MNIFYLDENIDHCVVYHNDKHVVKMILEYSQLLSTAHHVIDNNDFNGEIYRKTHINHPSSKWVRTNDGNYSYLFLLLCGLHDEYTYRYDKIHKSKRLLKYLENIPKNIDSGSFFQPTQTMPERYKSSNTVEAYRNYYINEKSHIASWKKREIPYWY